MVARINTNPPIAGKLVRYVRRPGVWRVLGIAGIRAEYAEIEPWDELAAASCHVSEAYSITARPELLQPANCAG